MTVTTGIFAPNLDNAERLLALLQAAESPTVNALTVVSGTAQEEASGLPSDIYVQITGGASGTVTVATGPTSATANTITNAIAATANVTVNFRLPAGWYFKVTVAGSAAVGTATQIVGG
jgi:hypothetical protein